VPNIFFYNPFICLFVRTSGAWKKDLAPPEKGLHHTPGAVCASRNPWRSSNAEIDGGSVAANGHVCGYRHIEVSHRPKWSFAINGKKRWRAINELC
jgi:hypothetical protein